MFRVAVAILLLGVSIGSASAALPRAEIERPVGSAQAPGAVHTLRQIPEACARLEGVFTGEPAPAYRFTVVRTSPQCQPRARLVEFDKVAPSVAAGWVLNDVIVVPQAGCPAHQAQVQVWRKAGAPAPALDGQGKSRIYLQDAKQQAQAGKIAAVSMYAAQLEMLGRACR